MGKYLLGLIFALITFQAQASQKLEDDIDAYMKLFSRDYQPTIADLTKFHLEYEGELEDVFWDLIFCSKKGWDEKKCNEYYLKEVGPKASNISSLYFTWLRTKIPLSPKIKILKTTIIRKNSRDGKDIVPYQTIKAKMENLKVVFVRELDKNSRNHSGAIRLTEIEGVSVYKMCKDYLKEHDPKNMYPFLKKP